MSLAEEKYVAFTTYRKEGKAVTAPVWWVQLDDGTFGFWTSSGSGKAKRLRHTAKVVVQPSDARGRITKGSTPTEGTAVIVDSTDPRYAQVQAKVKAKYGAMVQFTKLANKIGGALKRNKIPYGDVAVIVTV